MSTFNVIIEGRLTSSPQQGSTSHGREFVQFPITYRDTWRDSSGSTKERVMHFEVLCWGVVAQRAMNLRRGDQVIVEASQLLPYINHDNRPDFDGLAKHERCGDAVLKMYARNLSVSMRFDDAHAGKRPALQRRGDVIVTGDGETYAADAYPDVVTDLELVHHRR